MNKQQVVSLIVQDRPWIPQVERARFFAPSNIALCKYWGKRNPTLNLPLTNSLSISLGNLGATTTISAHDAFKDSESDEIIVNGKLIHRDSAFFKNLSEYLDLFRTPQVPFYQVDTEINIPIGAGLASSACGYAAVAGALDQLYAWNLSKTELSLIARLGSGSACRSFWQGFVEWQAGVDEQGMDSFATPLSAHWPALQLGLLIVDSAEKPISSRLAMQKTVETSPFYSVWPNKQAEDLRLVKEAISQQDFHQLGKISESNALAMHALMLTTDPVIQYSQPETIQAMHQIWKLRAMGLPLYFTQDAGPNLKLLFLQQDLSTVKEHFPKLLVIAPFYQEETIGQGM